MSRSTSATRTATTVSRRRQGARSRAMAVDTRAARQYRRAPAEAQGAASQAGQDWRDRLIPMGVIASLSGILVYHHATLAEMVGLVLWR